MVGRGLSFARACACRHTFVLVICVLTDTNWLGSVLMLDTASSSLDRTFLKGRVWLVIQ